VDITRLRREVKMNNFIFKATLAIAFSVGLFASQAIAVEKKVDCSKNQTLQQAVDTAPTASGDIFYIQFEGTCEERVVIRRDNTRINGGGIGTISGTVSVLQSDNVWLQDLTVTGPREGVRVTGGSAILDGVTVSGNELDGILVSRQGSVSVRGETIISANGNSGAFIDASVLDVNDATFEGNSIDGILAVSGSKVLLANARLLGNQGAGVAVTLHSIVDIRSDTQIAGNGYGGLGVLARLDSGVWISGEENVVITDRIQCEDYESSFHTDHDWPAGWVYCSGF
jgi:pectin methylesterase-like acyl-CoA thioesterase